MDGGALERNVTRALDFIERGASALTEAGVHIQAMADSIQKHGVTGLLPAPSGRGAPIRGTAPAPGSKIAARVEHHRTGPMLAPKDAEEARAILNLRLERAVRDRDAVRVQHLSHALDELEGAHPNAPMRPCADGASAVCSGVQKPMLRDAGGHAAALGHPSTAALDGVLATSQRPTPPVSTPCTWTPCTSLERSWPDRQHHTAPPPHADPAGSQRPVLGVTDGRNYGRGDWASAGCASGAALVPAPHGMGGVPCHAPSHPPTYVATLVGREQPPATLHSRTTVCPRHQSMSNATPVHHEQRDATPVRAHAALQDTMPVRAHAALQHAAALQHWDSVVEAHRMVALPCVTRSESIAALEAERPSDTRDRARPPRDEADIQQEPLADVYEVEKVLDVRATHDGGREFLIKWKGWGARWNNWEPEVNILDRRMLRKFNRPPMPPSPPRPEMGMPAEMKSKRRCAKRAVQEILACAEQECD